MSRNLHAEITARILAHLEKGVIPWRKPWKAIAQGGMPRNAATGRSYSGANVPLLWCEADDKGYAQPLWLTYKQAQALGGNVRKGEKSTLIIYADRFKKKDEETGETQFIPFLKGFPVFNVAQCDGLEKLSLAPPAPINTATRDALADGFIATTGATITHGGNRAYFQPKADFINLPDYGAFLTRDDYYATAFHELIHWTGHESRLNREFGKRFGDKAYSAEELVAEMGAAFVCAEFGFDNDRLEIQHAAYIDNWMQVLKGNEKMFVAACSAATKAVEFMRGAALADGAAASPSDGGDADVEMAA